MITAYKQHTPVVARYCPDKTRAKSALINSIKELQGHYNTGIIGFRWLFDALSDMDEHNAALNILRLIIRVSVTILQMVKSQLQKIYGNYQMLIVRVQE